tara:strand:+ start:736 stop:1503 length:768 start_codon:yes stop_codon:yes gene_type:complete
MTIIRNRKQLPPFGYLKDRDIDIQNLVSYCNKKNLLNQEKYEDVNVTKDNHPTGSSYTDFVIANEFCKEHFFKEKEAGHMEGKKYRQLYLTEFDKSKRSEKVTLKNTTIFERTKRLNPNNSRYLPEADERNYGKRNKLATGIIGDLLDSFKSPLARVRFAYLAPGFNIKPHVDYDPSYIVRFHIPLITNEKCTLGVKLKGEKKEVHLPANGKIYFVNTGYVHWANNNSDESRIHLIVDTQKQDDLQDLTEYNNYV